MALVDWTDTAENSLFEIAEFIMAQSNSRKRALDVVDRIEELCHRYAQFPQAGTLRPDVGPGLRCFHVDSLLVFFRPSTNGIVVILVAHGHQDVHSLIQKIFPGEEP